MKKTLLLSTLLVGSLILCKPAEAQFRFNVHINAHPFLEHEGYDGHRHDDVIIYNDRGYGHERYNDRRQDFDDRNRRHDWYDERRHDYRRDDDRGRGHNDRYDNNRRSRDDDKHNDNHEHSGRSRW